LSWAVVLSKQAVRDIKKIRQAGLASKSMLLLKILQDNPFANPPKYEHLVGNLKGYCSRRINIKHRLVYSVDIDKHVVHVLRCWTHYE